jgi:FkbH-like protein
MIINPKLTKDFKIWYSRQIEALEFKRKKCIVLDCDNTLWGGVLGEEGTFGIKLGEEYPGICFKKFQELLVGCASKGIILAICSKNNEADVFEVWEKNLNNVLNLKSISCYKINWQDKLTNLSEIAEELNIGLDSMVFIDDNPVERNLVKNFLPQVSVPDFPDQPYLLIDFFWKMYNEHFIIYKFSEEDLSKTKQYQQNIERNKAKQNFSNIDEYLRSLNIEVYISYANESNLARIAQMTQKTNQFNLTTKRYTIEDIVTMLREKHIVFCAEVKDKFGNNGITAVGILKQISECEVFIDSYLLSCRILGRNIEEQIMFTMLNSLLKKGFKNVIEEYIPTKKNMLSANFFEGLGFTLERNDNGTKHYTSMLDQYFSISNSYTINLYEE